MKNLFSRQEQPSSLHLIPTPSDRVSLGDLLEWGKQELAILGSSEASTNAEGLLAEITSLNRSDLYLAQNQEVPAKTAREFRVLIEKRKRRIPLPYLTGEAYFWNEVLEVDRGCLIPRPETEILVERFIENSGFEKNQSFSFWTSRF